MNLEAWGFEDDCRQMTMTTTMTITIMMNMRMVKLIMIIIRLVAAMVNC